MLLEYNERKLSNVVPIPKGMLFADATQYRPISILPVLSKVAEKLIFRPLYKYLESNGLLAKSQSNTAPIKTSLYFTSL